MKTFAVLLIVLVGVASVHAQLQSDGYESDPLSPNGQILLRRPIPYLDIQDFGPVAIGLPSTTGSISSGSNQLIVASAKGYRVGMGVRIDRAGAKTELHKPTKGICTSKGILNGPKTRTYEVFKEDYTGGLTSIAIVCAETRAPATLGLNKVALTQAVRLNGTTTYISKASHNLESGQYVLITDFTHDYSFDGVLYVTGTPTPQTFTVDQTGLPNSSDTTSSAPKATAKAGVQVRWGPKPGPHEDVQQRAWICRDGTLVGVQQGIDPIWFDYGNDIGVLDPVFSYIPKSCSNTPQSGYLTTTITGIRGNVLTLAAPAETSVNEAKVTPDNTPLVYLAARFLAPGGGGTITTPWLNSTGVRTIPFVSTLDLNNFGNPGAHWRLLIEGPVAFENGVNVVSPWNFQGDPQVTFSPAAFTFFPTVSVLGPGFPIFLLHNNGGSSTFSNLQLSEAKSQLTMILTEPLGSDAGQSGYGLHIDRSGFNTNGSATNDSLLILKADSEAWIRDTAFNGSSNTTFGPFQRPAILMAATSPGQGKSPSGGLLHLHDNMFTGSGIELSDYYSDTTNPSGSQGSIWIHDIITESLVQNFFKINLPNGAFSWGFDIEHVTLADNLLGPGTCDIDTHGSGNINAMKISFFEANYTQTFCGPMRGLQIEGQGPSNPLTSMYQAFRNDVASNSELPSEQGNGQLLEQTYSKAHASITSHGGFFGYSPPDPMNAPTLSLSLGGTVPVGVQTYSCSFFGYNGGESVHGPPASIKVIKGKQTVTVKCNDSLPTGILGYMIQRHGARAQMPISCTIPITTNIFIDNSATVCGQSSPMASYDAISSLGAKGLLAGAMSLTPSGLYLGPTKFSSLPPCAHGTEGMLRSVSDSITAAWGETISGQGTHHVLAYCDGTHWTVIGR